MSADKVLEAMFEAGAGTIGDNYKDCAFQSSGVGQFTPSRRGKAYNRIVK